MRIQVSAADLHRCYLEVFGAVGVPRPDATHVADSLAYADLRGIDTHGAARLPVYVERIEGGGTKASPRSPRLWTMGRL